MYSDSVPQSHSHLLLGVTYNAPVDTGRSSLSSVCPRKFNNERLYKAEPVTPGKQSYGSKLVHRCDLQGYQCVSVKLPRIAGSFDFYAVPRVSLKVCIQSASHSQSIVIVETNGN
jgi:hypothetical protein